MKDQNQDLAIGLDIGGTNIKMGLVTRDGQVLDHVSHALVRKDDGAADVSAIGQAIEKFAGKQGAAGKIAGIGVASPGLLDSDTGVVHYAVNLGWSDVNLVEAFGKKLQMPVQLAGDAVAGALGEKFYGAGKDLSSFLYVCIGTGVGASLYQNDRFYAGDWGSAINFGHAAVYPDGIPCDCGNRGCLEKYVSATAITRKVRDELGRMPHHRSVLRKYLDQPHRVNPYEVFLAAQAGDEYSLEVFREAGIHLGTGLVNCLHLFGVGNIVIGGGVSQAGNYLLDSVRRTVSERFPEQGRFHVKIESAIHPTLSGVLGAAAAVFKPDTENVREMRTR